MLFESVYTYSIAILIAVKIDSAAVPGFIRSCEKNDGGYGPNAQADKSDVQSTRYGGKECVRKHGVRALWRA